MSASPLSRNWLLAVAISLTACGSEEGPEPEQDAGRDAGNDAARDAQRPSDAAKDAAEVVDCLPFTMPDDVDCSPPDDGVLPRDLRCTGLYGRPEQREIACDLLAYEPAYLLWSDGAEKRRFASIPSGKKIDVSDPDAFVFPEGTKFWKEFSVKGTDGKTRLAETRLLQKGPDGWLYTSYVWNAAQTAAIQMDNMAGVVDLDVGGSHHTVPNRDQCSECHGGRSDQILGFDALMLGPGSTGLTREKLVELDLVTGEIPALTIPGNKVEKAALAYLHANCGISCHNETPASKAHDSGLFLRLEKNELASVSATDAFRSGMNKVPNQNAKLEGLPPIQGSWLGIRPGDPDRSLLIARQVIRGFEGQMPRIGTLIVDDTGVQQVVDWIESMTTAGGYPAAEP